MSSFIHSNSMAWSPNVKMYHVTLATPTWGIDSPHKALLRYFCSVLQPSSIRGLATQWTYFLHLSLSSVILIDSSTGESCPRLDVVHPGRAWPSSPSCTWHCSLHYLFLHAISVLSSQRRQEI